jgi:hypothetical protein
MKIVKLDGRYRLSNTYRYKMVFERLDARIQPIRKAFEQMYGASCVETYEQNRWIPKRTYNDNWRHFLNRKSSRNFLVEFYYNNESDATVVTLMI